MHRFAVAVGVALSTSSADAHAEGLDASRGMALLGASLVTPLGTAFDTGFAPRVFDRLYLPMTVEAVLRSPRWSWSAGVGGAYFFEVASIRASGRYRHFRKDLDGGLLSDVVQTIDRRDLGVELAAGLVWRRRSTLLGLEAGKYFPIATYSNQRVFRDHRTGERLGVAPGSDDTDATETRWLRAYVGFVF